MKNKTLIILLYALLAGAATQAQPLQVEQVKDSAYSLTVHASSYKLVWSNKPDNWKNAQPVKLASEKETVVLASAHPIVRLDVPKVKPVYEAPRGVKLQGANNFRDLGGYPTKDGKEVKWGKIYRSADISKLTDKDLKVITELNIKMVCDLRGEKEVETAPDRIPDGTDRILLSAGSENVGGANSSFMKAMKSPESADSMMRAFYGRTDHLSKKYKPVFDQLLSLEDDKALMFHCTAGKDRTGVGAALVLYALGVEESVIYQDYEATNDYRKAYNEMAIKGMAAQGISQKTTTNMMAARKEYLQTALDAIKKQYGSIDSFLEKEMGLTADKRIILKKRFLY